MPWFSARSDNALYQELRPCWIHGTSWWQSCCYRETLVNISWFPQYKVFYGPLAHIPCGVARMEALIKLIKGKLSNLYRSLRPCKPRPFANDWGLFYYHGLSYMHQENHYIWSRMRSCILHIIMGCTYLSIAFPNMMLIQQFSVGESVHRVSVANICMCVCVVYVCVGVEVGVG